MKAKTRISFKLARYLAIAGAAVFVASSVVYATQSPDRETSLYPVKPSLQTIEAETAHLGPDRTIIEPGQDGQVHMDESQLQRHGLYRLIPDEFVGDVKHAAIALPWNTGTMTSDASELTRSPLYVDVRSLPEGLQRVVFDSHDSTSGVVVRQVFKNEGGQQYIEVTRRAIMREPVDVRVPGKGASLELSRETLAGRDAIVFRRSKDSPNPVPLTIVQTNDGDVETIVVVRGLPESVAFMILNDLT